MSKEEQVIFDAKLKADKKSELSPMEIIQRTCFIGGFRFPETLPIMHRTIAGTYIQIRVCASCQSSLGQFTPARITSFITEDENGVFSEKEEDYPTLEKLSEMTKDEVIVQCVIYEVEGWSAQMSKSNLIETFVSYIENKEMHVATK